MKDEHSICNVPSAESADRVQFIAEVSSNHQRDLSRALRFIDQAADAGCDGVKFQLFRIKELFAPEILEKSARHRDRARWELPADFLPEIAARCREREIKFGCTPFYLEAVDTLAPLVDFLKIASYELLWDDLLRACAETRLPLILSTGMASLAEVRHAVDVIAAAGATDLTLLHCVSGYPAQPADAHLAAIDILAGLDAESESLRIRAGWSDHTVEPGVLHRAVHAHPTRVIEFHLDLEGDGDEFETGHCWLPHQIARTIRDIRCGEIAEGEARKEPAAAEDIERSWRADPRDGLRPLRAIRSQWTPSL